MKPKLTPLFFHSSHAWYAWLLYYKFQQFFLMNVLKCTNVIRILHFFFTFFYLYSNSNIQSFFFRLVFVYKFIDAAQFISVYCPCSERQGFFKGQAYIVIRHAIFFFFWSKRTELGPTTIVSLDVNQSKYYKTTAGQNWS